MLKLFAVCPRKVRHVNLLLAQKKDDMADVLDREENLVTAMEILYNGGTVKEENGTAYFKAKGIQVFEATEKQKEQVYSHLSDNLKSKVKTIYRLIRCV